MTGLPHKAGEGQRGLPGEMPTPVFPGSVTGGNTPEGWLRFGRRKISGKTKRVPSSKEVPQEGDPEEGF